MPGMRLADGVDDAPCREPAVALKGPCVYSLLLAFQPDVAECVCCAAGPKLLIQARLARLKGDIATAKKDNSLAVKFVRCAQPAGASCRVWSRSSTGAIATGAAPRRAHPCNI